MIGQYIANTASVLAFQDSFLAGALITFAALVGVFLLPAKPLTHVSGSEPIHLE
jgi:hypothetical protein